MGKYIFDQYSLLHVATGIIAYFWGISLSNWLIVHLIFEMVENTKFGMHVINQYIRFWPGGKPKADTLTNSLGDQIAAYIGWTMAYHLDVIGRQRGWYNK